MKEKEISQMKNKFLKAIRIFLSYAAFLLVLGCVPGVQALTQWEVKPTSSGTLLEITLDDSCGLGGLDFSWKKHEPDQVVVKGVLSYRDFMIFNSMSFDFKCIDLRDVQTEKIPFNSFVLRENLETFICPANLKIIESGSFNTCPNLKKVIVPTSLDEIKDCCFQNCENLELQISPKVKLGKFVFSHCPNVCICDPVPNSEFSFLRFLKLIFSSLSF